MASDSSSSSSSKPWWAIDKEAWREKFSMYFKMKGMLDNPPDKLWTEEDVRDFIASDPLYGPQLKAMRKGVTIASSGAVILGLTSAGIAAKYSKSPHGTVLSLLGGAAVGWVLGEEAANLTYGLHKFDCMETNLKFHEWWKNKIRN